MTDLQRDWRGWEGRVLCFEAPRRLSAARGVIPDGPPRLLRVSRDIPAGSVMPMRIPRSSWWIIDTPEAQEPVVRWPIAGLQTAYSQALDQLDRRAADRDLYDRITAANFTGPEYRQFVNALAAYGIAVVTAWLVSGEMFKLCAAHHRSVGSRPQTWTDHDISELADDTVAAALIEFRNRGLAGAGWEYSEDGASLTTYFITGCVLAFPNVYRKWERAGQHWRRLHDLHETFDDVPTEKVGTPDVDTTVLRRLEAAAGYAGLSEKERLIVDYKLAGYSNAEIAELLEMASPRAVEGALYRLQQKANERREQEGGDHT